MGRTNLLRRVSVAVFTLILSPGVFSAGPATAQSSLPGSPQVFRDVPRSLTVGDRDVLVSLPEGYDPARAYPVLLIAYARGVVDAFAAHHPVDRARIYAVGHSNGGAFTMSLACRAPDLVAGVMSVSGMFYQSIEEGCVGGGVPVMLIHASNDDVALIDGGVRHGAPFLSTYEIFQRWGTRNGCLAVTTERVAPAADATHRV